MYDSNTSSAIVPYPLSNHSSITIRVGEQPSRTGPGLWRLDNSLLSKEKFRSAIDQLLLEEANSSEFQDPMAHWDWIKFRIKSVAVRITRDLKAQAKQHEKSIQAEFTRLRYLANEGKEYDPQALQSLERELGHGENINKQGHEWGETFQIFS